MGEHQRETPAEAPAWWERPFDDGWTLSSVLGTAAARYGSSPAVLGPDGSVVTHAEIAHRSRRLRGAILAAAPEGARVVACLVTLGAPWFVAVRAVFTSGLAYAALDPEAPDERNRACLDDSGADVILADRASLETATRLSGGRVPVVEVESGIESGEPVPVVSVDPESVAAYLFTSGSTGRPKAVIRSHRSYVHACYSLARTYRERPENVMLYPGSPAHVGTLNDVVCCLLSGFQSIPMGLTDFSVTSVCDALQYRGVTVLALAPSLLRPVLQELQVRRASVSLRQAVTSGAALRRVDIGLFHEVLQGRAELWQNYGSTEAGPIYAARYDAADAHGEGPLELRVPAHGCGVEIVDADGREAGPGQIGDVVIRSEYLADGYLLADAADRARFDRDERGRLYRIGDRGKWVRDGVFVLVGRGDRQISVHGRRFDLGEVESAILRDSSWRTCVAVQVELQSGQLALVALVEPRDVADCDVVALRARLVEQLPAAVVPQRILVIEHLPRTTTGKVDLSAAQALAIERIVVEPRGTGGPPRGIAENWIADCWEAVLTITRPGRKEVFHELGGDSLAAIQLLLMLERRFGISLSLDRFADAQTIADQVRLIDATQGRDVDPLIRLRSDGEGPVLVMLPGIGGHAWVFANLARELETRCDVVGVSLLDLALENPDGCGPDGIARHIVSLVHELGTHRPLVLGGYSFGAIIASSLARALGAHGVEVARHVLIDPSPLNRSLVGHRVRTWARSVRRVVGGSAAAPPRSAAAARLESDIAVMDRAVARLYPLPPVPLGPEPVSLLLTETGQEAVNGLGSVFGRPLHTLDVTRVDCGHLDVLRASHVALTAHWLDSQL